MTTHTGQVLVSAAQKGAVKYVPTRVSFQSLKLLAPSIFSLVSSDSICHHKNPRDKVHKD